MDDTGLSPSPQSRPSSPVPTLAASTVSPRFAGLTAVLMLVLVLVAYWPSLRGDFLWDDSGHITSPELQSWSGLARIWLEPGVTQQYYPVVHSAFWIEHRLWGENPMGYRLVNVLWHALSSCLLVVLLRRLQLPGALLAGLLFALHPVAVETVAWVMEQKNTLSTLFYLSAALAWLRFDAKRRPHQYALATLLFVAAVLSKSVTATLPAALLVLTWWRRGRLSWRWDVLPLAPWLVAGVAGGLFTAWFEHTGIGAQGEAFALSWIERGLLAGRVFWFYLGKLAWPTDLTFHYPRWEIDASAASAYLYPAAGLLLLVGLIWLARRQRGPLAAFLLYGGTLFPVLGFVNVYPFIFSYVADHFQYLASLSMFAFGAALLATGAQRLRSPQVRQMAYGLAGCLVAALGWLSWRQSHEYTDMLTLYRATLARNPESWVANHNLAYELGQRGEVLEALSYARIAVRLKPDFPEALNNLANYLIQTGSPREALPHLQRALELQPTYAQAENTWGTALVAQGRHLDAVRHFQRAIELDPKLAEAHYNLGLAACDLGNFAEALPHFAETLRLQPTHTGAELNTGIALTILERPGEARPHFERALALDPASGPLRQMYGRILMAGGNFAQALPQLEEALRLAPDLPGLHADLATTLYQLGRHEEAREHSRLARAQQ